jgi:ABC-type transporter Mla subunit MlaD
MSPRTAQATRKRRRPIVKALRRAPVTVGLVVTAVLAGIVYLALISTNGIPVLPSYRLHALLPRDAPTISPGDQARVAGQVEGIVTSVRATSSGQLITFTLSNAAEPVGRDVRLTIRPASAAGGDYLAVDRGDYATQALRNGSTLPPSAVSQTESVLDVIQGFDRSALRELSSNTQLLGFGVAGQGGGLNAAFAHLGQTLGTTAGILRSSSPGDDLATLVSDADQTAIGFAGLAPMDTGRLTHASASFFGDLADARPSVGDAINRLRPAEDQLLVTLPVADPLLTQTASLGRQLTPAVRALRNALPSVNALFAHGPVLSANVPPLVAAGEPPLRSLSHAFSVLPAVASMLGTAAGPLGPLAAYIAPYGPELASGFAAMYAGFLYRAPGGVAAYSPTVPAMIIFNCATGVDPASPPGGRVWHDHASKVGC